MICPCGWSPRRNDAGSCPRCRPRARPIRARARELGLERLRRELGIEDTDTVAREVTGLRWVRTRSAPLLAAVVRLPSAWQQLEHARINMHTPQLPHARRCKDLIWRTDR